MAVSATVVRGIARSRSQYSFRHLRVPLAAHIRPMHLYLGENPRTLYLTTSQHDEKLGRPQRVLVFRIAPSNPSQAVVEFLRKDQVDLSSAVLITSRVIRGCMGFINLSGGKLGILADDPFSTYWHSLCMKTSLLL